MEAPQQTKRLGVMAAAAALAARRVIATPLAIMSDMRAALDTKPRQKFSQRLDERIRIGNAARRLQGRR